MKTKRSKVLLIYTGGTIGMMQDPKTGSLKPFDFRTLSNQIPELKKFDIDIDSISFKHPIDSSDMHPDVWVKLAEMIKENYLKFDGFVILHGSDTMSFTASALSFMLENLGKPIVLTGSQLPIGIIRTDGKENLITAIEIAAAQHKGKPVITEVCVYFEYKLYRGNRTLKFNSEHFDVFKSPNYPPLAEAGIEIGYNYNALLKGNNKPLKIHTHLNTDIAVIHLFPGINQKITEGLLKTPGLKAVVLLTFGAGNATTQKWFTDLLKQIIKAGVIVLNVTQCQQGRVVQGMYQTSSHLKEIGVVSGNDITFESAVTKLMYLLGRKLPKQKINKLLETNLRGEISIN